MDNQELKKIVEEKTTDLFGKEWENLPTERKEKIIGDFVEVLTSETDRVEETIKDLRDQNRDAILFIFGLALGVLGGLIAQIIQSFLFKYGVTYDSIVVALSLILCGCFIIFIRSEKSKTFRSNKIFLEFSETVKKELAKNKK